MLLLADFLSSEFIAVSNYSTGYSVVIGWDEVPEGNPSQVHNLGLLRLYAEESHLVVLLDLLCLALSFLWESRCE